MKTRGAEMLALRKARMAAAPPILRGGFRPFFFGGAAWAVIALFLWLIALLGGVTLPLALDPLSWHRHEMLFGFVGAVMAGFLLTAIPNWTGRLPTAGSPLAALFCLWFAGRLTLLTSEVFGLAVAGVLDVSFYLVLAYVCGREVLAAKNSNVPIVGLVLLFGLADALDYIAVAGLIADSEVGFRAGIGLVLLMISLIGGRIIPSFTRNWMAKQGIAERLPTQPDRFDLLAIGLTAAALLGWVLMPYARISGLALALAGIIQAVRLSRWAGWRTLRDPLVLILHVGYCWVPLGLLLLALSILGMAVPRTAAIHALTAGAMATMTLAVMTRATLGHTGRELRADLATTTIFLLVTAGALLRVGVSFDLLAYQAAIESAGAAWGGAFLVLVLRYGPIFFRPKA